MKNRWEVSVISPIHIGSGEKYSVGLDSVVENSNLYVIDLDKLSSCLNAKDVASEMSKDNFNIGNFLKNKKIDCENVYSEKISIDRTCINSRIYGPNTEVSPFIRDAYLQPYLPGSSIKGAVRTALLYYIIKNENKTNEIKEKISKEINSHRNPHEIKKKIGKLVEVLVYAGKEKDAKYDMLKTLRISDSQRIGNESTSIYNIKVYGTRREIKIFAQCVKPETKTELIVNMDDYFIKEKEKLGFRYSNYLDRIPEACNKFAEDYIKHELNFYNNVPSMKKFYEDLKLPSGNDEFLLHFGWGVGWLGLTLGLLLKDDQQLLRKVLNYFRLDRYNLGTGFPKSRKVVWDGKDAKMPIGWAKIKVGGM